MIGYLILGGLMLVCIMQQIKIERLERHCGLKE